MAGWMGLGMDIGVLLVCLEAWGLCGMDPVDCAFFWGYGSRSDGIDLIVLLGFGILNLSVN